MPTFKRLCLILFCLAAFAGCGSPGSQPAPTQTPHPTHTSTLAPTTTQTPRPTQTPLESDVTCPNPNPSGESSFVAFFMESLQGEMVFTLGGAYYVSGHVKITWPPNHAQGVDVLLPTESTYKEQQFVKLESQPNVGTLLTWTFTDIHVYVQATDKSLTTVSGCSMTGTVGVYA